MTFPEGHGASWWPQALQDCSATDGRGDLAGSCGTTSQRRPWGHGAVGIQALNYWDPSPALWEMAHLKYFVHDIFSGVPCFFHDFCHWKWKCSMLLCWFAGGYVGCEWNIVTIQWWTEGAIKERLGMFGIFTFRNIFPIQGEAKELLRVSQLSLSWICP